MNLYEIAAIFVAAVLLFTVGMCVVTTFIIYNIVFIRTKPGKWSRKCSWKDPAQQAMFDAGVAWGEENKRFFKRLTVENDGLKLVGDYFDFGYDKAVIIVPGRSETGAYAYYFANIYPSLGYNVLAIDNRAHGLSEGKYNTLGVREQTDVIEWIKELHDNRGCKEILIHAICIGCATSLYALTRDDCPEYVRAFIADGMYTDFRASLRNHMIDFKKPPWPVCGMVMRLENRLAGRNLDEYCPLNEIGKMKKPTLFIYSNEDKYSTPDQADKLFAACGAPKKLARFEHGRHSHVRFNSPEGYDKAIADFIKEYL